MKTVFVLGLVVLMTYGSFGLPVDDPAASAVPSPAEEVIAVPVAASPEVAPEIAPVAPIAPSAPVEPAPPNQQGNGYITHQKNPDGSTITITRFNGQIPASAFPAPGNQFASPFGSPFGNPSPYFWPSPWGYPGAINYNPSRV